MFIVRSFKAYPVDVCASLADVPLGVLIAGAPLDLQQRGVLVLVAEAALEPGEAGLGIEPSRLGCHLGKVGGCQV